MTISLPQTTARSVLCNWGAQFGEVRSHKSSQGIKEYTKLQTKVSLKLLNNDGVITNKTSSSIHHHHHQQQQQQQQQQ